MQRRPPPLKPCQMLAAAAIWTWAWPGVSPLTIMRIAAQAMDRLLARITALAAWTVLPVLAALFLQWPLRDLARCCSREANDLGQWLFALYIAVSVVAATRAGTHLAADALSRRYAPVTRRTLRRIAALVVALPFSLILLRLAVTPALESILRLETFGDTGNPGYFLVRAAVPLMALLIGVQALVDCVAVENPET